MTVEAALNVVDAALNPEFEQPSRTNISPILGRKILSSAASAGYDPRYIKDVGFKDVATTLKH